MFLYSITILEVVWNYLTSTLITSGTFGQLTKETSPKHKCEFSVEIKQHGRLLANLFHGLIAFSSAAHPY